MELNLSSTSSERLRYVEQHLQSPT